MQCFITWTKTILGEVQGEIIAIDGKTVRRSYDKKQGLESIHMVNAWATQAGLALGQVKTDAKSNEITAIPQLIALLELKGQIVSIDAMGCQTAIAQAIVKKQADYVLAVKDNQKQLHESIVDFFDTLRKNDTDTAQWHEQTDAGHGRIEVRRYVQSACLLSLPNVERWQKLTTIGMVESQRMVGEKTSCERRYYVSSLPLDVVQFAKVVRSHWGIENSLHWVLDVTMREDNSRLRRENAACNFAVVRQVVLNLLKKEPSKSSIKRKQFRASLSDSFRHHIIQNSAK
jgi:predicted transposase YbfD/YdcC